MAAAIAATAISQEVHSIRTLEITYANETFTVNDIYKSILRDVRWHYERVILKIDGTWKPTLLENYGLTTEKYPQLNETGKVSIQLYVINGLIDENVTSLIVIYDDEVILQEHGLTIQQQLYDDYTK